MSISRRNSLTSARRAFTLLEAIIALTLMTMILVASLELRVQSMRTGADVGKAARETRHIEVLCDMLINRALPDPVRDEAIGGYVWRGNHFGEPYIITRVRETVANPIAELGGEDIESISEVRVWRYTITYQGESATLMWHR